ncbi:uncharacterized protein (TIGR00369 family) [Rubricella aquisinus]|uniref:Uncharacterized protein (TIGR00369 family) n=1 Tax=Rubricella aquisinus TaxID=2028108 RepID=A0A840WU61_9RHOB|nr:YiiD C-terminal domain-containing protein [Rubricella aquisinus]MBB5514750.1 uncharacterized protein (TIGR00369 family) [Rubricella aquisinus]
MIPRAMIKSHLNKNLPFAQHAGITLSELGDGTGVAVLPQSKTSVNHIGTQHAGALFTVGETASGAALAGLFPTKILSLRPVTKEARIQYLKIAKGTITATAHCVGDPDDLRKKLKEEGRAVFDITVSMTDEAGVEVATLTVTWDVRKS